MGNSGGYALGRAAAGVVHVAEHDGAAKGGGDGAADLRGGEGGSPVAVDGEADEAIGQSGDNPRRDVVTVGGASPEEPRRDALEPGEVSGL